MFEREVNEKNIIQADIAVVIPSYKEADNIDYPTRMASEGLIKYFPDLKSVIINADNASPDETEQVFLNTEAQVPKIYITTPKDTPGKGWNFLNAWRKCKALGVRAIVCIDADLKSVTPEWIKYMVEPILKGYDYLTPLYSRHKYDGTITNNICYPLIFGIFGKNIRQPIGGDFALSSRLADYLLTQPWNKTTYEYGIDIFMTMNAILGDFKIAQVGLGSKIHKPSAPKLGPMFIQVVSSALFNIVNNIHKWENITNLQPSEVFGLQELQPPQDLQVDKEEFKQKAIDLFNTKKENLKKLLSPEVYDQINTTFSSSDGPQVDADLWVEVLFDMLVAFKKFKDRNQLLDAMKCLYFTRVYSFMNETWNLTTEQTEEVIKQQGQKLFEKRNQLIQRLRFI